MRTSVLFLLVLLLSYFTGCRHAPEPEDSSQEVEIQKFKDLLDSLETVTLSRIELLEGELDGIVTDDSTAIRKEITYLRDIYDDIITEKDVLSVAIKDKWRSFPEATRKSILAIEKKMDRTQ